jgi:TP901 family phage tail tape measure protein
LDFTSSITLKYNDLFSAGFREAHGDIIALRGTLEGITGTRLTDVQAGLTGMQNALGGMNPGGLTGVKESLNGINGAGLTEVQTGLTGMQGTIGGINPAGIPGVSESIGAIVPPLEQVIPQIDELAEMLGGIDPGYLDGMSESLEGIGRSLGGIGTPLGGSGIPGGEVPRAHGFGDVFQSFKTDTITNGKQAIEGMNAAMEQINKNQAMNRLAADLSIMANMTAPMRNALSSMMGEPSRLAGTFESSMKNIQAITGLSAAEIDKLGTELLSIGGKAVGGPQAVAAAYNDVAGGITKVAAQMPVMTNALALAEAGQADLGVAANGLVKIMNSYNFTVGETAEINARAAWASDVMTQAVGMGVGSMNEFVSAMAPISGMAASVGIGFDEIGSTMAYMTATTDTAATAGTKLQSFMAALQRPSDALATALQSVGISSGSAMLAEYGLAESARIVSNAFNGDQDAIAQAMGRMEAMKAVVSLTGSTYTDFAVEFGATMDGITAKSQSIQTESYESKVAKLNAATDSLQIKVGADINRIKGFFVDMGAGFLTHAVSPIINSPIGPVFTNIAAGAGLAAKGVLDMGSGVLNAAAQFSVLAVNIQNVGGFTKLFTSSLQLLGAPFKAVGTMVGGFIANLFGIGASSGVAAAGTGSLGVAGAGAAGGIGAAAGATGAFAASLWAAAWPILAVVAGVALVAGGVYLLVKNWSAVSGFFVGLWQNVTGAFSAAWDWIKNTIMGASDWILIGITLFFPFIGIPALIIKHWDVIPGFFAGLWQNVTGAFSAAWDWIKNTITGTPDWLLAGLAVFTPIIGIPSLIIKHWEAIKTFFTDLWNDPKAAISGFIDWIGGKVEAFTAPFRAIGDVVGGVFGKIGGFFKGFAGDSAASGVQMNAAFAGGIQANAQAPTQAFGQSLTGIDALMPHSDAKEGPLSQLSSSGRALTETFASGMESGLENNAANVFQSALPQGELSIAPLTVTASALAGPSLVPPTGNAAGSPLVSPAITTSALPGPSAPNLEIDLPVLDLPRPRPERTNTALGSMTTTAGPAGDGKETLIVNISNLTVQADDCEELFDILRQFRHIIQSPQGAAV